MGYTAKDEYARNLASLEGNDFQLEVSAFLEKSIIGFQVVPAKPTGDAGLDALSHNGEKGYCCYGPEYDQFKDARKRVAAIVKKFKSDLRWLFELEIKGKKLVYKENLELPTILPAGKKLKHIYLVVNWFESHRILGPIGTAIEEFRQISSCRYVDQGATVTVMGPNQLADWYGVDESSVLRSQQRIFVKKVQQTAQAIVITTPGTFDEKMEILKEIRSDQALAIDRLAQELRRCWCMALAFETELDKTLPRLHEALEDCRWQIAIRVSELMLSSSQPWTQLSEAHATAEKILASQFGTSHSILLPHLGSGEVARLIGECPIGWKRPANDA